MFYAYKDMKKDLKPQEEKESVVNKESEVVNSVVTFDPSKDTTQGKQAADQLINIVEHNNVPIVAVISGNKFIKFEGWQTVAKYYHCSVKTEWVKYVEYGGIQGFEARANVVNNDTGMIIGAAESICMKDEANWRNKPLMQLKSQAQTRACSKALRQVFAWVVVLAGYNASPAEEMTGTEHSSESQAYTRSYPTQIEETKDLKEPALITAAQQVQIRQLMIKKGKSMEDIEGAITATDWNGISKTRLEDLTQIEAETFIKAMELKLPDKKIEYNKEEIIDLDEADRAVTKALQT